MVVSNSIYIIKENSLQREENFAIEENVTIMQINTVVSSLNYVTVNSYNIENRFTNCDLMQFNIYL